MTRIIDPRGILDEENGLRPVAERHSLVPSRQEAAVPQTGVQRGSPFSPRQEHHELGQVFVGGSQRIRGPRSPRRPPQERRAREQRGHGRLVQHMIGLEGSDQRDVIGHLGDVGKKLGDVHPALAMPLEVEGRSDHRLSTLTYGDLRDALSLADRIGKLLAPALPEEGLLVEELDLRETPGEEDHDHALGPGVFEIQTGSQIGPASPGEKAGEREGAEAQGRASQERAPTELGVEGLLERARRL